MKRINIILTLSFCILTGCGIADRATENCGGDLDPWCDAIFGFDRDELEQDIDQNRVDIDQNSEDIRALEGDLAVYYSLVRDLEADLEQGSDTAGAAISRLETLITGLQSDLAEVEGRTTVERYIDPCGDSRWFDEVLLQMSDGSIVAYFQSGSRRFLTVLDDGHYVTTDRSRCSFSIVNGEYVEN